MTTTSPTTHDERLPAVPLQVAPRVAETKSALKTTEFFIYLATVIAIIITASIVGASKHSGADPFGAYQALQLITFTTIGYLIARGLAKSGTRHAKS